MQGFAALPLLLVSASCPRQRAACMMSR